MVDVIVLWKPIYVEAAGPEDRSTFRPPLRGKGAQPS